MARTWCCAWVLLVTGSFALVAGPGAYAADRFESVEAVSFAGDDFIFPVDIRGEGLHLVFLGIATDQKNGEYQGEELIKWHRALQDAGVVPSAAKPWHFSVMNSPPFFVKGVIRRAIAKTYEGLMSLQQGSVLYVDDVASFSGSAGIELDGKPTIVLYKADGTLLQIFKGEASAEGVAAIAAAVATAGA